MSSSTTMIISATTIEKRHSKRSQSSSSSFIAPERCLSLHHTIKDFDLSSPSSPSPTLSSLRQLVLSHLAELEDFLSHLDDFGFEALKARGESTVDDARVWASTGLEILHSIRSDVSSHLPDLDIDFSVENLVNHLPDVKSGKELMNDVRSHLPDIDIRSRLPDLSLPDEVQSRIDNVRTRFNELDFQAPLNYIPILNEHIESLHAYLSYQIPSGINSLSLAPGLSIWHDMIDSILSSKLYLNFKSSEKEGEEMLQHTINPAYEAVQRSLNGSRLILYVDLPKEWRNNPYVMKGYRFIPLEKWPLLILSLFALHNETLNIHTHLIPSLLWIRSLISSYFTPSTDMPLFFFTSFSLVCLLSSAIYHTMIGCAHLSSMKICSMADYVGIGWLISASVGTLVHYGFGCHDDARKAFLFLCLTTAIAGTIFPFMSWFNKIEYRIYRVIFFLCLAFTSIIPMMYLCYLYSTSRTLAYVAPIVPSILSYVIGLVFYVTHFPERFVSKYRWYLRSLDFFGGGSHAIWHAFIVLAIILHRRAMAEYKLGIEGMMVDGRCS